MCIIWHKNCITSLARLPWYIAHEKMFSVALLAYGNHEPYFWFFSPFVCVCVCVCVHMHSKIISYYVSFFLHQKEYTAWKRSMQTFLFFVFFLLKFWLRKFLALIGFLWVWSITELCMEDANLKSSGFTVCTSVACHLKVILDSAWNRLEWFSKIRVLDI